MCSSIDATLIHARGFSVAQLCVDLCRRTSTTYLAQALSAISVPAFTLYTVATAAAIGYAYSNELTVWGIHKLGYSSGHGIVRGSVASELQRAGQTGNLNQASRLASLGGWMWPLLFAAACVLLRDILLLLRSVVEPLLVRRAISSPRGGEQPSWRGESGGSAAYAPAAGVSAAGAAAPAASISPQVPAAVVPPSAFAGSTPTAGGAAATINDPSRSMLIDL